MYSNSIRTPRRHGGTEKRPSGVVSGASHPLCPPRCRATSEGPDAARPNSRPPARDPCEPAAEPTDGIAVSHGRIVKRRTPAFCLGNGSSPTTSTTRDHGENEVRRAPRSGRRRCPDDAAWTFSVAPCLRGVRWFHTCTGELNRPEGGLTVRGLAPRTRRTSGRAFDLAQAGV